MGKLTKIIENYEKEQVKENLTDIKFEVKDKTNKKLSGEKASSSSVLNEAVRVRSSVKESHIPLPHLALSNIAPQILTYHKPDDIVSENFKILRSQVLHPRTGLPSRFILVTSSVPEEGKTYVAVNLAFSFARTVPTLLIEADLRRPVFKKILGIPECSGLSNYLMEEIEISKCIYETNFEKLYLMPAGTHIFDTRDYLLSDQIVKLLDVLKTKFSNFFFIFDSPPVLVASEAIALSRLVDGVLFVVRYGYSDREVVSEALEKIGKSKVLGLVFNAYMPSVLGLFSPKLKYFRYAYKYKYYK